MPKKTSVIYGGLKKQKQKKKKAQQKTQPDYFLYKEASAGRQIKLPLYCPFLPTYLDALLHFSSSHCHAQLLQWADHKCKMSHNCHSNIKESSQKLLHKMHISFTKPFIIRNIHIAWLN